MNIFLGEDDITDIKYIHDKWVDPYCHNISEASPLDIFISDAQGHCIYSNAVYRAISKLTSAQFMGSDWNSFIHPDDYQRVLLQWQTVVQNQVPFYEELCFLRKDDSASWARIHRAAFGKNAQSSGYVQIVEDSTERKTAECELRITKNALFEFEEKERAQVTLNSIGDAVLTTDLLGNIDYMNRVAEKITGWSYAEAVGRPLPDVFRIVDSLHGQVAPNPVILAMNENRTVYLAVDCVLIRRDGIELIIEDTTSPIHNRLDQVTGAVIVFRDVSKSRKLWTKMAYLAQHDALTNLPNRVLLMERFSQAIRLVRRSQKQIALLYLDLDNFKHINDSLGHVVGDQLLQSAAKRLSSCVRNTDTVCRQGGDEFVILLAEIERPQDAAQVAEMLHTEFALPHVIGEHELYITLSIGIGIYLGNGTDMHVDNEIDALIQNADAAMYHAKKSGRNRYRFFRADMNA